MSKQDPNDLMNKLEVDARASGGLQKDDRDLEVRMTPQARRAKIDAVLKLLAQLGVTKGHAAKAIGKSAAVTQVLNDRYGANPGPILRQLHRKLRDLQQIQEGPGHGEFVTTAVAREVFIVVKNVIKLGTIGVMWGPAGVGKSLALRASAQQRPDSIYVEVMSHWTAAGLAEHLAHAMGVPVSGPLNTSRTVHRILQRLTGSHRLLLFDEAHLLKREAMTLVRQIHDALQWLWAVACLPADDCDEGGLRAGKNAIRLPYQANHKTTTFDGALTREMLTEASGMLIGTGAARHLNDRVAIQQRRVVG